MNDVRLWTWFDQRSLSWKRFPKNDLGIESKVLLRPLFREDSQGSERLKDLQGRTMVLPFYQDSQDFSFIPSLWENRRGIFAG